MLKIEVFLFTGAHVFESLFHSLSFNIDLFNSEIIQIGG